MAFILIVGAGRVGSAVARKMLEAGHEVSVIDEDPLSHERLDAGQRTTWEDAGGRFTIGQAIERDALVEAGIEQADVFVASPAGDNTSTRVAQIARRLFDAQHGLVRVMDPARAECYEAQGLQTIWPTSFAVTMFEELLAQLEVPR